MTVAAPDTLWTAANELLAAAVDALQDNSLRVPEHLLISWHAPAWDCCDHLGVYVDDVQPNSASSSAQEGRVAAVPGTVTQGNVILTFVGCAAVGDPIPTDDAIRDNAHTMYRYGWVLYQELICRRYAGTLFSGGTCTIVRIGKLSPRPPQGGCESFTITFTLEFS